MSTPLKALRVLLILLGLPGLLVTLFTGSVTVRLLWAEHHPDPADIGHGMAMAHGFIPMLAWTLLGLAYLLSLWLLWLLARKISAMRAGP